MEMASGQIVEIVYENKTRKLTQCKIEIVSLHDGRIRAKCLTTGAPRVFLITNILAWHPVRGQQYA